MVGWVAEGSGLGDGRRLGVGRASGVADAIPASTAGSTVPSQAVGGTEVGWLHAATSTNSATANARRPLRCTGWGWGLGIRCFTPPRLGLRAANSFFISAPLHNGRPLYHQRVAASTVRTWDGAMEGVRRASVSWRAIWRMTDERGMTTATTRRVQTPAAALPRSGRANPQ